MLQHIERRVDPGDPSDVLRAEADMIAELTLEMAAADADPFRDQLDGNAATRLGDQRESFVDGARRMGVAVLQSIA